MNIFYLDGKTPLPRWYSMSLVFEDTLVIEVPIHYAILAQKDLPDYDMVEMAVNEIEIKEEFIGRGEDRAIHEGDLGEFLWGFGGCLTQKVSRDSVEWSVDLKGQIDKIELISGSLSVLFGVLGFQEIDLTPDGPHQLLGICSFMKPRFGPGSLGALLSPKLCDWLDDHSNEETRDSIHKAMIAVWHSLSDKKDKVYAGHDFHVTIRENGFISLSVPGNGCGLDPSDRRSSRDEGSNLSSHNLDQFRQQLTLLCGLAKLYQLAVYDLG